MSKIKPIDLSIYYKNKTLKPISEYAGPILKLTSKDKLSISQLQNEILELEAEQHKIANLLSQHSAHPNLIFESLNSKSQSLHQKIEGVLGAIRNIKLERIAKQRAKEAKNRY